MSFSWKSKRDGITSFHGMRERLQEQPASRMQEERQDQLQPASYEMLGVGGANSEGKIVSRETEARVVWQPGANLWVDAE